MTFAEDADAILSRVENRQPSVDSESLRALAQGAVAAMKARGPTAPSWSKRIAEEITDATD